MTRPEAPLTGAEAPPTGMVAPHAPGALSLEVAGTQLWLRPDGTVWWPAQATLFGADLHLGKGASFRRAGQPLPAGSSAQTLEILDAAARACQAARVVVLGDFWHHALGLNASLQGAVTRFALRWPTCVVQGNHDRHVSAAAVSALPIEFVAAPLPLGPLRAVHAPVLGTARAAEPGFTLAGHLHPAVILASRSGDRLRRPCFMLTDHELVLPALGRSTGQWAQRPATLRRLGVRAAVLADGEVRLLP